MTCTTWPSAAAKAVRRTSWRRRISSEALLERGGVERSREPEGGGDVVGRAAGLQLVEKPQSLLGEGCGKDQDLPPRRAARHGVRGLSILGRPFLPAGGSVTRRLVRRYGSRATREIVGTRSRAPLALACSMAAASPAMVGVSKRRRSGSSTWKVALDSGHDPGGEQGMAPQLEEVVVDARPGGAAAASPRSRPASPRAECEAKTRPPSGSGILGPGGGSAPPVELPVRSQRQLVHEDDARRDHHRGQELGQVRGQVGRGGALSGGATT